MKKYMEQKEEQRADLLDDYSRMKHKLKSIENCKQKYKREKTENSKLDFKLRIKSKKLCRKSMEKKLFEKKANRLTLDLSKRTLCEICQRPKDKKDELTLQNEKLRNVINL